MTGYGINKHFAKELGLRASPSVIYSALAIIEREGWVKCVDNQKGRIYALTTSGIETLNKMQSSIEESKRFLNKLLTPSA